MTPAGALNNNGSFRLESKPNGMAAYTHARARTHTNGHVQHTLCGKVLPRYDISSHVVAPLLKLIFSGQNLPPPWFCSLLFFCERTDARSQLLERQGISRLFPSRGHFLLVACGGILFWFDLEARAEGNITLNALTKGKGMHTTWIRKNSHSFIHT